MKRITRWIGRSAAGVVTAICLLGSAAAGDLRCPLEIAVDQKATAPAPQWAVNYNGFKNELAAVTIYDGSPDQGASLVYDDQKTVDDTLVQTWKLAPNPRGYWIKCGYSNTSAEISEKIPVDATHCEAVYERNVSFGDGRRPIRSADCGAGK
ncbi:MAG: STY0301 family protein [Candidatus Binataceae bacterium]